MITSALIRNTDNGELRLYLEDGKYELVRTNSGTMYALRYKREWREMTGDKLVNNMLSFIDEQNNLIEDLKRKLNAYEDQE